MESTNSELYRLVLHDAPYVIAAYGVLWAAFVTYVALVMRRLMRLESEVSVVEEAIAKRAQT